MSHLVFGEGSARHVGDFAARLGDPVLLVVGAMSFELSGAASLIQQVEGSESWVQYVKRQWLPTVDEAVNVAEGHISDVPEAIIAVGGGGVIDLAKLIAIQSTNPGEDLTAGDARGWNDAVPIVAVPTTAGSGAERTPFAVAFREQRKYSVEHQSLLPAAALVDPGLTRSMNQALTASSGLDALAHAVESFWSRRSTGASRRASADALSSVWQNLRGVVIDPNDENRREMARAASRAGEAIAVARTTVCHALSYYLTAHHRLEHGFASAITLGSALTVNSQGLSGSTMSDALDEMLEIIGAADPAAGAAKVRELMTEIGAPTRLSEVGVDIQREIEVMAKHANRERLANNPVDLSEDDLVSLLRSVA